MSDFQVVPHDEVVVHSGGGLVGRPRRHQPLADAIAMNSPDWVFVPDEYGRRDTLVTSLYQTYFPGQRIQTRTASGGFYVRLNPDQTPKETSR
jgi:hypothetical protein